MMMSRLPPSLLWLVISLLPPTWAYAEPLPPEPPIPPVPIELLEFLGEWETAEGEWIDPAQVERLAQGKHND